MKRPSDDLKRTANKLASLLATDAGIDIVKHLAILSRYTTAADAAVNQPTSPRRIGIWEERLEHGQKVYVRAAGADMQLWANAERIGTRSAAKRVVLLGESVARGYFYDPFFNPAAALSAILNEGRSRAVEVVDLARIDLGMKALMDLFHDSITLQPDAVVIFAGNNWHPSQFLNATDQEQMQEMELADRPLYRRRKFLESRLANEVQSVLGELGNVAKGARVPVIFVLPENNHLDWQFNSGRAPSLAPAGLAKWLALREQLKRSFEQGDADGAHRVAEAMTGLDGRAHAFASQMQARLCLQRGLLNEARSHLARARDADIIAAQAGTPRCYSIIQRTVRQHAEANGLVLVDLPSELGRSSDGLPGRSLFHDYCHLTARGITLAMSCVARAAAPVLGLEVNTLKRDAQLPIQAKVLAEAALLAAIHNAKWGQDFDIVRHHCQEALRQRADMKESLLQLLDFHIRRAPTVLCQSFETLVRQKSANMLHHLFATPRSEKSLNATLVKAITAVLTETVPGIHQQVDSLLAQEHGLTSDGYDLLAGPGCASAFRHERDWRQVSAFFRAYEADSDFQLVLQHPADIDLTFTSRVVRASPGQVAVKINSEFVGRVEASEDWQTVRFKVPSRFLCRGINSIVVSWPAPAVPDSGCAADAVRSDTMQFESPVFGEIHTFIAGVSIDSVTEQVADSHIEEPANAVVS